MKSSARTSTRIYDVKNTFFMTIVYAERINYKLTINRTKYV